MAINFTQMVYEPSFDVFSRLIVVTPLKSQPTVDAYNARGIYSSQPVDVPAEEGTVFSDSVTIVDVIEAEFVVVPIQGDLVNIPSDSDLPEIGDFEVIDTKTNGGGETTLVIRRLVETKP